MGKLFSSDRGIPYASTMSGRMSCMVFIYKRNCENNNKLSTNRDPGIPGSYKHAFYALSMIYLITYHQVFMQLGSPSVLQTMIWPHDLLKNNRFFKHDFVKNFQFVQVDIGQIGAVISWMPVVCVGENIERATSNQFVYGRNNFFSIFVRRTLVQPQGATDKIILHIHNQQRLEWRIWLLIKANE